MCSAGDCIHQLPVILQQSQRFCSELIEKGQGVMKCIASNFYGSDALKLLQHLPRLHKPCLYREETNFKTNALENKGANVINEVDSLMLCFIPH